MIEAAFFDMDGTILQTDHVWDAILGSFVGDMNLRHFRRLRKQYASRSYSAHCTVLRQYFDVKGTDDQIMDRFSERAASLIDEMHIPFVDGFIPFYNKLSCKTALITNAPDYALKPLIKKLHLDILFNGHIYNSDMVNAFKPDPAVINFALKNMNLSPEQVVMFEDSVEGIVAAHAAGINNIRILESPLTFKNYYHVII